MPPTFQELVAQAQTVFVGETIDVRARWVSTPKGPAIVTEVTYRVVRTLKGQLGSQTVLEFLGGSIGEDRLEVSGMPKFRLGDRDVLFVDERDRPVSPIVAMANGRFRVTTDPVTGRESISRYNAEPLASVNDLGPGRASRPRIAAAEALSLVQFETEIVRAAGQQPAQK